jgi:hypothetical protein
MTSFDSTLDLRSRLSGGFGVPLAANSALVNDACERRSRAFFSASQRER